MIASSRFQMAIASWGGHRTLTCHMSVVNMSFSGEDVGLLAAVCQRRRRRRRGVVNLRNDACAVACTSVSNLANSSTALGFVSHKETKRPSKEMQVTIARQLGLEPTTVGNFFMNARRRSMDKWKDEDPNKSTVVPHEPQQHSPGATGVVTSHTQSLPPQHQQQQQQQSDVL
uniref:Uncharacterized protein n=1 Tax=Timema douglasi TaxID=61478 RepID=A0A7R8ZAP6_TIMDO|nr:unnamed protein product [Timema douglasi]